MSNHPVRTGSSETPPPLHQLMYGLIYPAVLGTGIVLIGVRAAHEDSVIKALLDPSIQLGLMACLFFCASFDSAFYWPEDAKKRKYTHAAFGLDFLEVILMFICFSYLRLFDDPVKLELPDLPIAYVTLMVDVLMQFFWRFAVSLPVKYKWWWRTTVAILLAVGAILGPGHSFINVVVSAAVGIFVIFYVVTDPRYKHEAT